MKLLEILSFHKTIHFLWAFKKIFLSIALVSFSALAQAPLDVRIALVIGNGKYVDFPKLANPGNDARSISILLSRLGFKVISVSDGTKEQINAAIKQMQDALKGQQAVAMLYYAGHGLQLNWHNYMVAVNSEIDKTDDIPKQTIDVDKVLQAFKAAGTRTNIIVLDACRDNPFESKASGKGLSQLDAPNNTYISFATAPGNVAQDGDPKAGNGLFTQYILQELQRPAPVEDMFKRVRLQVRKASNGMQVPWDSSSLEEAFAFNDGARHTFNPDEFAKEVQLSKEKEEQLKQQLAAAKEQEKKLAEKRIEEERNLAELQKVKDQAERAKAEQAAKERDKQIQLAQEQEKQKILEAQKSIEQAKLVEEQKRKSLELAKINESQGAQQFKVLTDEDRANQFAREKADWDRIKDSTNANDFYAYLDKYPNGLITQQATFRLNELAKIRITAQADKYGIIQTPGEKLFRVGDEFTTVTKDAISGKELQTKISRVDKIENGRVYISSNLGPEIRTEDGATISIAQTDAVFTFDPPMPIRTADDLQIGKKWTSESIQSSGYGTTSRTDQFKIVGVEEITVPAGTFKAFVIMNEAYIGGKRGLTTAVSNTLWLVPGNGIAIKRTRNTSQNALIGGKERREVVELVSYKKGS